MTSGNNLKCEYKSVDLICVIVNDLHRYTEMDFLLSIECTTPTSNLKANDLHHILLVQCI